MTARSTRQSPDSNMQKAMLTFVKSSNMNSQNGNGNRRKSSTPQRRIKQQQRFNSSQNDTPPKRTTRYEFKIQNLASNPDSMSLVRGRAVGFAVTKDTDGEGGCPAVPVSSKWRKPAAGRASLAPSGKLIVYLSCVLADVCCVSCLILYEYHLYSTSTMENG